MRAVRFLDAVGSVRRKGPRVWVRCEVARRVDQSCSVCVVVVGDEEEAAIAGYSSEGTLTVKMGTFEKKAWSSCA